MNPILLTAAGNPENQDRGAIEVCGRSLVLVVADGAGGLSGGTEAAVMAVTFVRQHAEQLNNAASCAAILQEIDQHVARDSIAGETTCALAVVTDVQVFGASVADSGVWIIGETEFTDLTQRQTKKPFIGSGSAWPVTFEHSAKSGRQLLMATVGLLKYASPERIMDVCRRNSSDDAARQLIELVRYPSGALPDDVTVILCPIDI
jgi:serine/threonine protein phosphatase PrpC